MAAPTTITYRITGEKVGSCTVDYDYVHSSQTQIYTYQKINLDGLGVKVTNITLGRNVYVGNVQFLIYEGSSLTPTTYQTITYNNYIDSDYYHTFNASARGTSGVETLTYTSETTLHVVARVYYIPNSSTSTLDFVEFPLETLTVHGLFLDSIEITNEPTKLSYYKNSSSVNVSGMTVVAKYKQYISHFVVEENTVNNYSISSVDLTTHGAKTVTVTYGGKNDTFTIYVFEKASSTFDNPIKMLYKTNELFSPNGAYINVSYEEISGHSIQDTIIDYDEITFDVDSYYYDIDYGFREGNNQIEVTYTAQDVGGDTITGTFYVSAYELSSISLNTNQTTKRFLYGSTLSASGTTVTANFSDGTNSFSENVALSSCTITYPSNTTIGNANVIVRYDRNQNEHATNTYQITIYGIKNLKVFYNGKQYNNNGRFGIALNEPLNKQSFSLSYMTTDTNTEYTGITSFSDTGNDYSTSSIGTSNLTFTYTNGNTLSITIIKVVTTNSLLYRDFTIVYPLVTNFKQGTSLKNIFIVKATNIESGEEEEIGYTITQSDNISNKLKQIGNSHDTSITITTTVQDQYGQTYTETITNIKCYKPSLSVTYPNDFTINYWDGEQASLNGVVSKLTYASGSGLTDEIVNPTFSNSGILVALNNTASQTIVASCDDDYGETFTNTKNINVYKYVSLSVNVGGSQISSIDGWYNQNLLSQVLSGASYVVTRNDGNTPTTTNKISSTLGNLTTVAGYTNVPITFTDDNNRTISTNINVNVKLYKDFEVTNINSSYYKGDSFTIANITYGAYIYTNNVKAQSITNVTSSLTNITINNQTMTGSYVFNTVGTNELTFGATLNYYYPNNSCSITKQITVNDVIVSSISVSTQPTKLSYVKCDALDLSGLVITETMNNGTTRTNTFNNGITGYKFSINNIEVYNGTRLFSIVLDPVSTFDGRPITITKEDNTNITANTSNISVNDMVLDSISVSNVTTPKTSYKHYETLNLDGLRIVKHYENTDYTDDIEYNANGITFSWNGSVLSNPNNYVFTTSDISGNLTITYQNKTCNLALTITAPSIVSISTDTSNVKTSFIRGDTFETTGLLVYATYDSNPQHTELVSSGYTITNPSCVVNGVISNNANVGEYNTTVTYNNKTTTYVINVSRNSTVVSIALSTSDGYDSYFVGQPFTAKNISVIVNYADGESATFSGNNQMFTTEPTLNSIFRSAGRNKVKFIYYQSGVAIESSEIYVTSYIPHDNYEDVTNTFKIGDYSGTITINGQTITFSSSSNIKPLFDESKITNHTYSGNNASSDCKGYVEIGNDYKASKVVLFDDYENVNADGNIIVKYPHYVSGYADRINKCKFGAIFNKRLFVSGNSDLKNCDWHTSAINTAQDEFGSESFTYFSDLDYCYYGNDETAVVGYDIYRDGSLLAVKEGSKRQATLYNRKSTLAVATDYSGNKIVNSDGYLYEESYPCYDINNYGGDGGLSNFSIINFMGDSLVLTKNGIKVIKTNETTYNSEKYSYDVSSYINPVITNENLGNAFLFTFKERLYLKTNRGVYIGEYALRNDNNEYEWYYITNVNANLFFVYDDELYFTTSDGAICRFTKGLGYTDNDRDYIGNGATLLTLTATNDNDDFTIVDANTNDDGTTVFDESKPYIIVSGNYKDYIENGRTFHLLTKNIDVSQAHVKVATFVNKNYCENQQSMSVLNEDAYSGEIDTDNSCFTIKAWVKQGDKYVVDQQRTNLVNSRFYDGMKVYFDNFAIDDANMTKLSVNTEYTLKLMDSDDSGNGYYQYKVYKSDGNAADLNGYKSFRVSYKMDENTKSYICNKEDYLGGVRFQLRNGNNEVLDFIRYNNQTYTYSGIVTENKVIKAYYVTKPYDFGTINYCKTIKTWTIANDTNMGSEMNVCYLTSRRQGDYSMVSTGSQLLNLNDQKFTWGKITFLNDKLPHIYPNYKVIPRVTFIRFLFINENASNIVLSKLSLIYTLSNLTGGVR